MCTLLNRRISVHSSSFDSPPTSDAGAVSSHPKSLTSGSEWATCTAPTSSWSAFARAWLWVGAVSLGGCESFIARLRLDPAFSSYDSCETAVYVLCCGHGGKCC